MEEQNGKGSLKNTGGEGFPRQKLMVGVERLCLSGGWVLWFCFSGTLNRLISVILFFLQQSVVVVALSPSICPLQQIKI